MRKNILLLLFAGTLSCIVAMGAASVARCDSQAPECYILGVDMVCEGDLATWCGPDVPGYTYYWTGPGGFTATTRCVDVNTAGTYVLLVTDEYGSESQCQKMLAIWPLPDCTITGISEICEGTSTTWCGPVGVGYTYYWTGPGGFTATARCVDVSVAGTYALLVADADGCESQCQMALTVWPLPDCTITGMSEICEGTSTTWCGPVGAGYTYYWTGPGGFSASTRCVDVSVAGTYALQVTDANGCDAYCQMTLTVNPLPDCTISGEGGVCEGASTTWCGPDGMGYTYYWNGPGGFIATTRCVDVSAAGTYVLLITDENGCQSNCQKTLTVWPFPECIITGPGEVCEGNSVTWCGPVGTGYTYSWSGPGGFNAVTSCVDVSVAGLYALQVTDANGCQSQCQRLLTVYQSPECVITGPGEVCEGDFVTWCGPVGTGYTYSWSGPGGFSAATRCVDVNAAGTYTLLLTDEHGCESQCQMVLTVYPLPECNITGVGAVCEGESATLCGPDVAGYTYYWSGPGGFLATTRCVGVSVDGTYTLLLTDENGCQSQCETQLVLWPAPMCDATPQDTVVTEGDTVTFTCDIIDGTPPFEYCWGKEPYDDPCLSESAELVIAEATADDEGTYRVTVMDANGCADTCYVDLIVEPVVGVEYILVSAEAQRGCVVLSWRVSANLPPEDFVIRRSESREGDYTELDLPVSRNPDGSFSCKDYAVIQGTTYWYNIGLISAPEDDTCEPVEVYVESVPTPHRLNSSHPNPFNAACTIRYEVARPTRVNLSVYNVVGSLVRTLVDAWKEQGVYDQLWDGKVGDGSVAPAGVYVCVLEAEGSRESMKLVLLK